MGSSEFHRIFGHLSFGSEKDSRRNNPWQLEGKRVRAGGRGRVLMVSAINLKLKGKKKVKATGKTK